MGCTAWSDTAKMNPASPGKEGNKVFLNKPSPREVPAGPGCNRCPKIRLAFWHRSNEAKGRWTDLVSFSERASKMCCGSSSPRKADPTTCPEKSHSAHLGFSFQYSPKRGLCRKVGASRAIRSSGNKVEVQSGPWPHSPIFLLC